MPFPLTRLVGFGRRLIGAGTEVLSPGENRRHKLRMAHHWRDGVLTDLTCYDHDVTSSGLVLDDTDAKMHKSVKCGNYEDEATGTDLVTNGDFQSAPFSGDWDTSTRDLGAGAPNGTFTWPAGNTIQLTQGSQPGTLRVSQEITGLTIGRTYKLKGEQIAHNGTLGPNEWGETDYHSSVLLGWTDDPATVGVPGVINGVTFYDDETVEFEFVATTTTVWVGVECRMNTNAQWCEYDNIELIEYNILPAKGTMDSVSGDNRFTWAGNATFFTFFKVDGPADADRVGYLFRKIDEMALKVEDAANTGFFLRAYHGTETGGVHISSVELNYGEWLGAWLVKEGSDLTLVIVDVNGTHTTAVTGTSGSITQNSNSVTMPEVLNQNNVDTVIRMEATYFWRRAFTEEERKDIGDGALFSEFPFENGLNMGLRGTWSNNNYNEQSNFGHMGAMGNVPGKAQLPSAGGQGASGGFSASHGTGSCGGRLDFITNIGASQPFEFNAWLYLDANSPPITLGLYEWVAGNGWSVHCDYDGVAGQHRIYFSAGGGVAYDLVTNYENRWINISCQYTGSVFSFFVDKVRVAQWGSISLGAQDFIDILTHKPQVSDVLKMSNPTVWDRTLTDSERTIMFGGNDELFFPFNAEPAGWCSIEFDSPLADGLLHFWPADNTSELTDIVGDAHATPYGSPVLKLGEGLQGRDAIMTSFPFPGVPSHYNLDNFDFKITGDWSFCFWCKNDGSTGFRDSGHSVHALDVVLIGIAYAATQPVAGGQEYLKAGSVQSPDFDHTKLANKLGFVVVTADEDADEIRFYLDGAFVSVSASSFFAFPTGAQDWRFIRRGGNGNWDGMLWQNLSLYNRALSASEVTDLYANGGGWRPDTVFNRWVSADTLKANVSIESFYGFEGDLTDEYGNESLTALVGSANYTSTPTPKFGSDALHLTGGVESIARELVTNSDDCRSASIWARWDPDGASGDKYACILSLDKHASTKRIRISFFKPNGGSSVVRFEYYDGTSWFTVEKSCTESVFHFIGFVVRDDQRLMWRFNDEEYVTEKSDHDLNPGYRLFPMDVNYHDGVSDAYVDGLAFHETAWTKEQMNTMKDDFQPVSGTFDVWYDPGSTQATQPTLIAKIRSAYEGNNTVTDEEGIDDLDNTNTVLYDGTNKKLGSHAFKNDGTFQLWRPNQASETLKSVAGWIRFDAASGIIRTWNFLRMGGSTGNFVKCGFDWRDSGSTQRVSFVAYESGAKYEIVYRVLPSVVNTWVFVGMTQRSDGRIVFRCNDKTYITSVAYASLADYRSDVFDSYMPGNTGWIDGVVFSTDEFTQDDFNRLYNAGAGREHPYT